MRNTYHDRQWISATKDGTDFVGINLGYDHCSEHEWGIRTLLSQLGVTSEHGLGIERHRIRSTPEGLELKRFKMKGKGSRSRRVVKLASLSMNNCPDNPVLALPLALSSAEDDDAKYEGRNLMQAAWDENGFVVTVMGAENIERLSQIHQAILDGDGCISLSSIANPFAGSGLCLTIASKVPQEVATKALQEDESAKRLEAAVQATGIIEDLESAKCRYYALSPQWTNESETDFKFFLNPQNQHRNNYGWMSVQDLRDWIRGEGVIVKQSQTSGRK